MADPTDEDMAMATEMAKASQEIVNQIAPLIVGQGSAMQGNVIAMMLGMWIAGHHVYPIKGQDEEDRVKAERDVRARMMTLTTKAAFAYAADLDKTRAERAEKEKKNE